ncbi:MAG: hypothetical protein WBD31_21430 [Rubripirellula sp.]
MKSRPLIPLALAGLVVAASLSAAPSDETRETAVGGPASDSGDVDERELSIAVTRERAVVTQGIYASTLRMLHDRYFHQDKRVLPARAMHDIFDDIEQQTGVKTRWISASLKPMSIDHSPKSEFEKLAAKKIADGSPHLELVVDGIYHRAIAIPLTGGCLSCHEDVFQNNGRKKFAGLVVSIPIAGGGEDPEPVVQTAK